MKTVLYSAIRPAVGQTPQGIIAQAQRLGYQMVIFNGWTDADLGMKYGDQKGPRRDEATTNANLISELHDMLAVETDAGTDYPHIVAVAAQYLSDEYQIL